MLLFISSVPRPNSLSFSIIAENGGCFHELSLPGGTTSVWPAKQKFGEDFPSFAYKFFTFLKLIILQLKPIDLKFLANKFFLTKIIEKEDIIQSVKKILKLKSLM